MARIAGDAVAPHHRIEIVAPLLRRQRAREAHGAEHRRAEAPAEPPEFVAQESVVEARVVRDEEAAGETGLDGFSATASKGGASATMASVMPVNCWMAYGNAHARIDERRVFLDHFAVLHEHDAGFDDPVARGMTARGLEVHAGDPACEGLFSRGHRPAS